MDNKKEADFIANKNEYRPLNQDNFEYELEIDYQAICKSFVKNNFDFELLAIQNKIDIQTIYNKNNNFNEEHLPDKIESLLYFEGTQSKINKHIGADKNIKIPEYIINKNIILPIINSAIIANPVDNINTTKGFGRYNPNQENYKKAIGNQSEQKVYASLCNEFGAEYVIWESKINDSARYDIKYKNQNGDWKFVEVKTSANSVFYISKNEYDFANKHKDYYEIYLVSSDEIHKITPVDFSKLGLTATEFEVNYKYKS
jgi:hypothetical protein